MEKHVGPGPVNLSELIEQTPPLGRFALDFEYFLIAENEYTQEALLKIRNIVSTLFLAESHYDVDMLEVELLNLFSSEEDKQAVSLFFGLSSWLFTDGLNLAIISRWSIFIGTKRR